MLQHSCPGDILILSINMVSRSRRFLFWETNRVISTLSRDEAGTIYLRLQRSGGCIIVLKYDVKCDPRKPRRRAETERKIIQGRMFI